MVFLEILPDEFLPTYFERLRMINGFESAKKFNEALVGSEVSRASNALLYLNKISENSNLTIEYLIQYHTLIPHQRAIVSKNPHELHWDPSNQEYINKSAFMIPKNKVQICEDCIQEDLSFRGIPYLRRSHQMLGMQFCSKHKRNLHSKNISEYIKNDFFDSPKNPPRRNSDTPNNKAVVSYQEIIEHLSSLNKPIPILNLVDVLQSKARERGLRWYKRGGRQMFSDYVLDRLPMEFLHNIFPTINNKTPNGLYSSIDGLLAPQNLVFKSASYSVALSVLFDSPDEALNRALGCIDIMPRAVRNIKGNYSRRHSNQEVEDLYVKSYGSPPKMANESGHTEAGLRARLKFMGLPSLASVSEKQFGALLDFYGGHGYQEVCQKYQVDMAEFDNLIRIGTTKLISVLKRVNKLKISDASQHHLKLSQFAATKENVDPKISNMYHVSLSGEIDC